MRRAVPAVRPATYTGTMPAGGGEESPGGGAMGRCGPRVVRHVRRCALACAAMLVAWTGPAAAEETPAAVINPPAAGNVGDVVVSAPEPRYVAPTLRDRIGRIWAPVLINDKGPFRLVLDTGADNSAVSAAVAEAIGVVPNPEDSVNLRGVTGTRVVPTIHVDSIVVGDLELHSKRLPIISDALGGADGILGTEGLLDKRIFIDFRHDKIRISKSHREKAEPGFTTIPVHITNGLLLVADVRQELRRDLTPEQVRLMKDPDLRKRVNVPRSTIPAITHVDMSARVQTVDEARHGRYYRLIKEFKRQTGCGVIINTSFNIRGEPIVCTPQDAYRCFMASEMDVLVLENCLLRRSEQPALSAEERQKYIASFKLD